MIFRVGGGGGGGVQFWKWNCDSISISVLELELVKLEIYGTEIETLGIGMKIMWMELKFLAVAKQLYEWFSPSEYMKVTILGSMLIH